MLILIAGITGSLGQRLAATALARGIQVRGLGRNPSSLPSPISQNLESFIQSTSYYDIASLDKAVSDVDAIINAYAPVPLLDLDGHLLLLRAAERAGVKIFITSSWSRDWTNISFGDFEHYDNHIAFRAQAESTSSIKPVYIFTGLFADLLYTRYGPGGYTPQGEGKARMGYWGAGLCDKWPWSNQDDVAEWTIDILMYGEGVLEGKGGTFKVSSGVTTVQEMADARSKVFGEQIEVVREGSFADLEKRLADLRRENGRKGFLKFMPEAAAVIAGKGGWENKEVVILEQFRKATSLEEFLREEKQN